MPPKKERQTNDQTPLGMTTCACVLPSYRVLPKVAGDGGSGGLDKCARAVPHAVSDIYMIDTSFNRYLKTFTIMVVVSLGLLACISFKSLFIDHIFIYQKLYNHQIEKLAAHRDAHTIFVGDSSLGNAINAGLFSDLTSTVTLNLALTGVYGYGGTLNMIKKAVKANPVRNVIVMLQSNTLSTSMTYEGYVYTFEPPHDLSLREWMDISRTFLNVTLSPYALTNIAKHHMGILDGGVIENDYVRQGERLPLRDTAAPIERTIMDNQSVFLKKISAFCRARNINLIYAHGPIFEGAVVGSAESIRNMDAFIRAQGFGHVVGPVAIDRLDVGDTPDHVYPAAKDKYTRAYFNLLKGLLK